MLSHHSCALKGPCLPLPMTHSGDSVTCVEVTGGPGQRLHLAEMGVVPGTRIDVISASDQTGPVIVKLRGGKLMLGRGMAHSILVRPD